MGQGHEMSRYARQTQLPEIGTAGQARLSDAHALVVGAGGLGAPVLQYLVGAGVGAITVVDADTVSLSNLHRQTLFRETQLGEGKAAVAAATLAGLNSDGQITPVAAPLTPVNAPALIADADIVIDCADSFAVSYTLSDHCFAVGKPLISASTLGFEGYAGGFCGGAPSLRAVFPELPQRSVTCAIAGVMGPVVGTIGAMQAQMALSALLDLSPSPLGQLMTVDLRTFRLGGFRFDGADEPDTILPFGTAQDIRPEDFVVDLREVAEAPTPITATAIRKTVADFDHSLTAPSEDQRAVLACRSGLRAWQAARRLQQHWNGDILLIAAGDNN